MTWLLAGLLIGVITAGLYGFERQRQVYGQLVKTLEADRDGVIKEMRVYRNLLFPVLTRAETVSGTAGDPPKAVIATRPGVAPQVVKPSTPSTSSFYRPRLNFRQRFNQARKTTNTPQINTDKLADAIRFVNENQKVSAQEKTHVT